MGRDLQHPGICWHRRHWIWLCPPDSQLSRQSSKCPSTTVPQDGISGSWSGPTAVYLWHWWLTLQDFPQLVLPEVWRILNVYQEARQNLPYGQHWLHSRRQSPGRRGSASRHGAEGDGVTLANTGQQLTRDECIGPSQWYGDLQQPFQPRMLLETMFLNGEVWIYNKETYCSEVNAVDIPKEKNRRAHENIDRYMHCIMQNFKINAQVCRSNQSLKM